MLDLLVATSSSLVDREAVSLLISVLIVTFNMSVSALIMWTHESSSLTITFTSLRVVLPAVVEIFHILAW